MSRKAKGKRPVYFNDPENDKLLAITMRLPENSPFCANGSTR
jgi:hypothetical protein